MTEKFFQIRFFCLTAISAFYFIANSFAQTYTVESVPDPKSSPSWNYVSNPDNVLSASTVSEINLQLKELEDSTTCQVAVVVLNSIGETVPKTFATELFNYWGIGDKEKDNGLLILMVMDQRSIEFETGKGMEGVLPDVTCKRIQEQFMVPYAKAGNYDAAVLGGVKAVVMQIEDPENAEELYAEDSSAYDQGPTGFFQRRVSYGLLIAIGIIYLLSVIFGREKRKGKVRPKYFMKYQNASYQCIKILLINLLLPAAWVWTQLEYDPPIKTGELLLATYIFIMILLIEKRWRLNSWIEKFYPDDRHEKHLALSKSHFDWLPVPWFFPIPFLFYNWRKNRRLHQLRNKPYSCEKCGNQMTKLDEKSDDQYLTKGQRVEEKIISVDYDVWHCYNCGNQEILDYINLYSKYNVCPNCKAKAYLLKETKTIEAPSLSSEGKGKKVFDCLSCHQKRSETFVIAKLTKSSSYGSGSSYSGSSGGGSGGSSWGGGSSGGGGAGTKW